MISHGPPLYDSTEVTSGKVVFIDMLTMKKKKRCPSYGQLLMSTQAITAVCEDCHAAHLTSSLLETGDLFMDKENNRLLFFSKVMTSLSIES